MFRSNQIQIIDNATRHNKATNNPEDAEKKKILRLSDQLSISKRMLANFFKAKHTSKDYFSFVLLHFVQDHKKK